MILRRLRPIGVREHLRPPPNRGNKAVWDDGRHEHPHHVLRRLIPCALVRQHLSAATVDDHRHRKEESVRVRPTPTSGCARCQAAHLPICTDEVDIVSTDGERRAPAPAHPSHNPPVTVRRTGMDHSRGQGARAPQGEWRGLLPQVKADSRGDRRRIHGTNGLPGHPNRGNGLGLGSVRLDGEVERVPLSGLLQRNLVDV